MEAVNDSMEDCRTSSSTPDDSEMTWTKLLTSRTRPAHFTRVLFTEECCKSAQCTPDPVSSRMPLRGIHGSLRAYRRVLTGTAAPEASEKEACLRVCRQSYPSLRLAYTYFECSQQKSEKPPAGACFDRTSKNAENWILTTHQHRYTIH